MAKWKGYKRSRRKQIHQSQETLLQKSDTSDEIDNAREKYTPFKKKSESSERLLRQRSPEFILFESNQPDLSYYDDLSPEIVPRSRRTRLDLNGSDINEKEDERCSQNSQDLIESEQTNKAGKKCFSLDKTLSVNDEIKLEMNEQEEKSFSRTRLDIYTCDSELHPSKSVYNFPSGYSSDPTQFTNFNSESESQSQGFHNFLDEFRTTISAGECASRNEEKWSGQDRDTRFEVVNEKNLQSSGGSRFASNWNECRRIFANLRQLNSLKVWARNHEYDGNTSAKYKKFEETRLLRTDTISYYEPPEENFNECVNKRPFVDSDDNKDGGDYREMKCKKTRIRADSLTPCSGSPPPAKRCRTTLNFDDIEEVERPQGPVASVTIADLLPIGKKNLQNCFYPHTTITKTPWSSGTSESRSTSILDLPVVTDSGGCSKASGRCRIWEEMHMRQHPAGGYPARISSSTSTRSQIEELNQIVITLRSENEQMINIFVEKVSHLSEQITQVRVSTAAALGALTAEISGIQEVSKKLAGNNETLMQELKKLQQILGDTRSRSPMKPQPPPPPPMPSIPLILTSSVASSVDLPPPPPPPPPPPLPPPLPSFQSPLQPMTPTTPNSSNRSVRTPSRKCSTPLFNRPAITVEDLLKVTLKKAPQNVKENRRNTIPGPKGPVVSLDMLRSVKLKSARRRTSDQVARSPRSGRMIKTRTAPSLSLSPIMTGADNTLGRILKQVDMSRRRPRRLLSSTSNFRENVIGKDNQAQSMDANGNSSTQSAIA